jgi:hypothetical protein
MRLPSVLCGRRKTDAAHLSSLVGGGLTGCWHLPVGIDDLWILSAQVDAPIGHQNALDDPRGERTDLYLGKMVLG